jgi:hypothetical protein
MKMGTAMINAQNDVNVVFSQESFSHPSFMYRVPRITMWDAPERLMVQLKLLKDIDLIHVHNEPTWLATVCKMVRPEIPVILDCHDLDTIRGETGAMEEEKDAFGRVDGFIFPSRAYQTLSKKHFRFKQPSEVIYSMVNDELFVPPNLARVNGVMYQGGIGLKDNSEDFAYRDFTEVAEVLRDVGIPFHLYAGHSIPAILEAYGNLGCLMHPRVHYTTLIQEQTRYDWGLLGTAGKHHQWDASMPNKLFEYILSGLPIICLNAKEPGEWVEKHGLGVCISDPAEIPGIYEQHHKIRKHMVKHQDAWSMEQQTEQILELYSKIVNLVR